jgi:hypothetical protein
MTRDEEEKDRNFPWAWRPGSLGTEAFQALPWSPERDVVLGLPIVGGLSPVTCIPTGTFHGIAPR